MARKPAAQATGNDALAAALVGLAQTMEKMGARLDQIEARDASPEAHNRLAESRGGQTRARQSRRAEEKVMPHMAYQSQLWIDPTKIPDDKEYFWVATSVLSQPLEGNLARHMRAGWSPVPSDRHPELVVPSLPGRERPDYGTIELQGLILMEKDGAVVRRAKEWLQEQNLRQLAAKMKGGNELNETVGLKPGDVIHTADETWAERVTQQGAFK